MMNNSYIYLFGNILLLIVGQVLFKIGLNNIGGISLLNIWRIIFSPYIIIGLFLYVVATGLWFIVLSKMPLSIAYPSQSMAYVFGIVLAWLIFGETITATRWVGVGVICVGVWLISK